MSVEAKLKAMGHELPAAAAPAANYVPYIVSGNMVFVSGQIPMLNGEIVFKGTVGKDADEDQAYKSAQLCALNIIAQVKAACGGDLSRVKQVVKLGGFVNCTADFNGHPKVINGASDLIAQAFGDAGTHARFAVGAPSLPLGVMTEVDAIVEIN